MIHCAEYKHPSVSTYDHAVAVPGVDADQIGLWRPCRGGAVGQGVVTLFQQYRNAVAFVDTAKRAMQFVTLPEGIRVAQAVVLSPQTVLITDSYGASSLLALPTADSSSTASPALYPVIVTPSGVTSDPSTPLQCTRLHVSADGTPTPPAHLAADLFARSGASASSHLTTFVGLPGGAPKSGRDVAVYTSPRPDGLSGVTHEAAAAVASGQLLYAYRGKTSMGVSHCLRVGDGVGILVASCGLVRLCRTLRSSTPLQSR